MVKKEYITVFSDGSWCPTTKLSGYGVWIKYGNGVKIVETGVEENVQDSTSSELLAVLRALEIVRERIKRTDMIVIVASDCLSAQNSSCWRGFIEKHPEHLKLVEDTLKMNIRFKSEDANLNDEELGLKINTRVDRMARECMRRARKLIAA